MPTYIIGTPEDCGCCGNCPDYKRFQIQLSHVQTPGTRIGCFYYNDTSDNFEITQIWTSSTAIRDFLAGGGTIYGIRQSDYGVATATWTPTGDPSTVSTTGVDGVLSLDVEGCKYEMNGKAIWVPPVGGTIDAPPLS